MSVTSKAMKKPKKISLKLSKEDREAIEAHGRREAHRELMNNTSINCGAHGKQKFTRKQKHKKDWA